MEKQLKEKTDALVQERFVLLDAQVKYLAAKEELELREAEIMRDLSTETNGNGKSAFSNAETRGAELVIRQHADEAHQEIVERRNDNWHAVKVQEIIIEHLTNEILNLRVVMAI